MNYGRNFGNNCTKINDLLRYCIIIDCLKLHGPMFKASFLYHYASTHPQNKLQNLLYPKTY